MLHFTSRMQMLHYKHKTNIGTVQEASHIIFWVYIKNRTVVQGRLMDVQSYTEYFYKSMSFVGGERKVSNKSKDSGTKKGVKLNYEVNPISIISRAGMHEEDDCNGV